jgi:DNA replication protein DnaC
MTRRTTPDKLARTVFDGLDTLGLPVMRQALEDELAFPDTGLQRLEWLWKVLEPQVRIRIERRIERRIRTARFPDRKTLSAFDFAFQPKLDKSLVMELATLRFIDQGLNVLLAGMSGTGKSHIAKALGLAACVADRRVRYTTSEELLAKLNASLADDTLAKAIKPYVRAELLILDELGLEQVERTSANRSGLLQKVLFPRHRNNRSTIITSNIPWEAWGDYLDDHLGAAAILDRLIYRSRVIVINGPSYREHAHKRDLDQQDKDRGPGDETATTPSTDS